MYHFVAESVDDGMRRFTDLLVELLNVIDNLMTLYLLSKTTNNH
jgi:hypothetical protein